MSMAAATTPSTVSAPLPALGGGRAADETPDAAGGAGGSGAATPKSFNSTLAAARAGAAGPPNAAGKGQGTTDGADKDVRAAQAQTAGVGTTGDGAPSAPPPATVQEPATVALAAAGPANGGAAGIAGRLASGSRPSARAPVPKSTPTGVTTPEKVADPNAPLLARSQGGSLPLADTGDNTAESAAAVNKDADSPAAEGTAALANPALPLPTAQALAALVHQLLAKDLRSESPVTGDGADGSGIAPLALTGGSARTGLGAMAAAELLMSKASDDSGIAGLGGKSPTADAVDATGTDGGPAAQALAVGFQTATAPTSAAVPNRLISVPVQSAQWPQALGNEIRWLTGQNIQSAVLRLSPEHLGPVQVNISVNAGHISVDFGATHPDTRAALEMAMPRLREMFSGAGLTLGEATVQQQSRQASQNPTPMARSLPATADTETAATTAVTWSTGLVDEYA